jgi:DNA polymerase beta
MASNNPNKRSLEADSPPAKKTKAAEKTNNPAGAVDNSKLIEILAQLGAQEKASGENYKASAYFKAVRSIKSAGFSVTSGREAEQRLEGVGKKIAAKIDEILATGQLTRLEQDKLNPRVQGLTQLTRVFGIGDKFAAVLYDQHRIRSLEELRKATHLLNSAQKIGFQLLEDFEQPIPLTEMQRMDEFLHSELKKVAPQLDLTICGSYRRGASKSGDIDCLLTTKSWNSKQGENKPAAMNEFLGHLKRIGFISHELAAGQKKVMAVCALNSEQRKGLKSDASFFNTASSNNSNNTNNSKEMGNQPSNNNNLKSPEKPKGLHAFFKSVPSPAKQQQTAISSDDASSGNANLSPPKAAAPGKLNTFQQKNPGVLALLSDLDDKVRRIMLDSLGPISSLHLFNQNEDYEFTEEILNPSAGLAYSPPFYNRNEEYGAHHSYLEAMCHADIQHAFSPISSATPRYLVEEGESVCLMNLLPATMAIIAFVQALRAENAKLLSDLAVDLGKLRKGSFNRAEEFAAGAFSNVTIQIHYGEPTQSWNSLLHMGLVHSALHCVVTLQGESVLRIESDKKLISFNMQANNSYLGCPAAFAHAVTTEKRLEAMNASVTLQCRTLISPDLSNYIAEKKLKDEICSVVLNLLKKYNGKVIMPSTEQFNEQYQRIQQKLEAQLSKLTEPPPKHIEYAPNHKVFPTQPSGNENINSAENSNTGQANEPAESKAPSTPVIYRRIDIRYIPYDQYGCALLYFTGSNLFNVRMRQRAIEMGLTLNEYHLTNSTTKEIICTTTEEDVFNALNMQYLPPEQRD